MRLQAWAPQGGGSRVDRRPPPPSKRKFFGYIEGLFATFSLYIGAFMLVFFFIFGCLFTMGGLFTLWWEPFLGLPPLRKFLRAPMIAKRVREHVPRKFFVQFSEFWTCFVTILP